MDITWKIDQRGSGCWSLMLTLSHGGGTAYTLLCPTAETPEAAFAWHKQVLRYFRRDIGPEHTGILWYPAVLDPAHAYIEVPKLTDGLTRAGLSVDPPATDAAADRWVYEDHARAVDARVRIAQALGLDTTLTDWTAFADAVTQKAAPAPALIEEFDELVGLALKQSGDRGCCCTYVCDCRERDARNEARVRDNAARIRRLLVGGA